MQELGVSECAPITVLPWHQGEQSSLYHPSQEVMGWVGLICSEDQ